MYSVNKAEFYKYIILLIIYNWLKVIQDCQDIDLSK